MYYPVYLDLKKKKCVVVGAGEVARRKVITLLEAGAEVTVVSPEINKDLVSLHQKKKITYLRKNFETKYLRGAFLVVGATDNNEVNNQVSSLAQKKGILVNIVDIPDKCNFIVPSMVKRGDLQISISTGGKSPALAKKIRKQLEKVYGPEYAVFLKLMEGLRPKIIRQVPEIKKRTRLFQKIVDSDIIELIKSKKNVLADKKIKKILTDAKIIL